MPETRRASAHSPPRGPGVDAAGRAGDEPRRDGLPRPEVDGFSLRWFTPATEVDLCGHATLASAHVLWTDGHLSPGEQARFQTLSGLLTADQRGDWIEVDFPSEPTSEAVPPPHLIEALDVEPVTIGRNRLDYIVELADERTVRAVQPDLGLLTTVPIRGVIVTSRADAPVTDFVSRFFAPAVGVPEDPVTGSAHCCLGPYWAERLRKDELVGYQAPARGGTVRVRLAGDRVKLLGQAVTVVRGELVGLAGEPAPVTRRTGADASPCGMRD